MRLTILAVIAVAASARAGESAPSADLVVVWAPGANISPIDAVARASGAAVIDRSPVVQGVTPAAELVQRVITAYDDTRYEDAAKDLVAAIAATDSSGAFGLSSGQLSDLFLYAGLVKLQLVDESGAWDDLVIAAVVDPSRALDPMRFPPKVIEQFDRAKETVARRGIVQLTVQAPPGCAISVDGVAAPGTVDRVAGPHWVRATCADSQPLGRRVELGAGSTTLPLSPVQFQPPTDAELLIQARASSVTGVIIVEVHDEIGTARWLGLDGRVRDRRTVSTHPDLARLAAAVGELLVPPADHHWYRSNWAWAGGGAAVAAAVLVPLSAVIFGSRSATSATIRPQGLPPL